MEIFETNAERYDSWYDRNRELYERELLAIPKPITPSLEVGVGTGRFARPLGIDVGVDVSAAMLRIARSRGVECIRADASKLPFKDGVFRSVYFIFTLCFLDKPEEALSEAVRVLVDGGMLCACIVPRDSGLGKVYSAKDSPFYRIAKFYTERELVNMLEGAGLGIIDVKRVWLGHSENDFVCMKTQK